MKRPRLLEPQLSLPLDATPPDAAAHWCAGTVLPYLDGSLVLQLDTTCREALLVGAVLHLPLPPEAMPRQIQDAAEAWLRAQAARVIGVAVMAAATELGRSLPRITFSFAARASWWQLDAKGGLRFHWRLIEQPEVVIAQVARQALANLPAAVAAPDMFALAA